VHVCVCVYTCKSDKNGDGNVDLDEFRVMIKTSRSAANLFTGNEKLQFLTEKQMAMLLLFDSWPNRHEGPGSPRPRPPSLSNLIQYASLPPKNTAHLNTYNHTLGDLEESEGLGGLISQVHAGNTDLKQKGDDGEESEDHCNRRHALEDRALGLGVDDPALLEVDALISQLKEGAANGALDKYKEWPEDIAFAEDIYLEDPDELEHHIARIRVKMMPKEKKLKCVIQQAAELVKQRVIAVPPETWKVPHPSDDLEVSQYPHQI
jgi:hypothetical protein